MTGFVNWTIIRLTVTLIERPTMKTAPLAKMKFAQKLDGLISTGTAEGKLILLNTLANKLSFAELKTLLEALEATESK